MMSKSQKKNKGGKSKAPDTKAIRRHVTEFKRLHKEINDSDSRNLQRVVRAGEVATLIRPTVEHGKWESWAEKTLGVHHRTVNNYMRVFDAHKAGKLKDVKTLVEAYMKIGIIKTGKSPKGAAAGVKKDLTGISFDERKSDEIQTRLSELAPDKAVSTLEIKIKSPKAAMNALRAAFGKYNKFLKSDVGVIIFELDKATPSAADTKK
jgi:hypothetical protein